MKQIWTVELVLKDVYRHQILMDRHDVEKQRNDRDVKQCRETLKDERYEDRDIKTEYTDND